MQLASNQLYENKEKYAFYTALGFCGLTVIAHSISTTNICSSIVKALLKSSSNSKVSVHQPFPFVKFSYPYSNVASRSVNMVWRSIFELSHWPERLSGNIKSAASTIHSPTLNYLHPQYFWASCTGVLNLKSNPVFEGKLLAIPHSLQIKTNGLCWGSSVYFNSLVELLTEEDLYRVFKNFKSYQPIQAAILQAIYLNAFKMAHFGSTEKEAAALTQLFKKDEIFLDSSEVSSEFLICFKIASQFINSNQPCLIEYAADFAKKSKIEQNFDFQSEIYAMHTFFRTFSHYERCTSKPKDLVHNAVTSLVDHSIFEIGCFYKEKLPSLYMECFDLAPGKYILSHYTHAMAFIITERHQFYLMDANTGLILISTEEKFNQYVLCYYQKSHPFYIYEMVPLIYR
ncbi:MAG: hypothetical protein P0S95_06900 [Rhabdochlamydiaceae bacterium]|nr:hypothetical protein [Candidatus Amphrikana amoebophyrae]